MEIVYIVALLVILVSSKDAEMKGKLIFPPKLIAFIKIVAVMNVLVGIVMISDVMMPKNMYEGVVIHDDGLVYVEAVQIVQIRDASLFSDGEQVMFGETKIFQEIETVMSNDSSRVQRFAFIDFYPYLGFIVFYVLSTVMFINVKQNAKKMKFPVFLNGIIILVFGVINVLIGSKVFMVHVLHIIDSV